MARKARSIHSIDTRTAEMRRCARHPLIPVPQQEFRWRGIECRPSAVYIARHALLVICTALGSDPRDPSDFDRQNAQMTAFIVARSIRWPAGREVRALLQYTDGVNVEISISVQGLSQQIAECLSRLQLPRPQQGLPNAVVTYLVGFIRRVR